MKWPDRLIRDIAARRAVLFFGSGVSANSMNREGRRPQTWVGFLKSANELVRGTNKTLAGEISRIINKNDLLTACEVIKRAIGRDAFVDLVRGEFQTPRYMPAKIHSALLSLDFRIAVTPNFDTIYDVFAPAERDGTITVKQYFDEDIADCLRGDQYVIIKSHGSVTQPDRLIFTRRDYAEARSKYRDFYDLINSLLRTHSFLFVGCGIDDPDIRLLLEDYCFRHHYSQSHYFVSPSKRFSNTVKEVLQDSLKLHLVEYAATADHAGLTTGLEELAAAVQTKRIEISQGQTW